MSETDTVVELSDAADLIAGITEANAHEQPTLAESVGLLVPSWEAS